MAVFIVQETDPFTVIAEREAAGGVRIAAQAAVRRPTRGIEVSRDVYSYLKVMDGNNREIPLLNSGAQYEDEQGKGRSTAYANYLLQRVQIQRAELKQFVKTFGPTYLFFFGENPIIATVEGALVHSEDFRWDEEWWVNYEEILRGSKLAERGARIYLVYEGVLLEGYILEASTSREAMARHLAPLAFQMVVTAIKFLRPVGQTDYPIRSFGIDLTEPSAYTTLLNRQLSERRRFTYRMQNLGSQLTQMNRAMFLAENAMRASQATSASLEAAGMGLVRAQGAQIGLQHVLDGGAVEFGSFSVMFRTMLGLPGRAAGLFRGMSSLARAVYDSESTPTEGKRPWDLPLRGKIWDNLDEYIVRPGTEQGALSRGPKDQVRRWQEQIERQEDSMLAGDAERLATDAAGTSAIDEETARALDSSHSIRVGEGENLTGTRANPFRSGNAPLIG